MLSHLKPSLQNVRFSKPEIAELNSLSTGDFPFTCSSFAGVDMRIRDDISANSTKIKPQSHLAVYLTIALANILREHAVLVILHTTMRTSLVSGEGIGNFWHLSTRMSLTNIMYQQISALQSCPQLPLRLLHQNPQDFSAPH
jgi:hypothetical protein